MEKKENTVFYKILIIILLVTICISVYFGFIKKGNISNNNQNESKSNSNLTTQDDKLEVEEITGFKVKELTVSINEKNSKFTISYNKTKKVDSEGNNNDAMEYQIYLNNVKVNGATGFYTVDVENGMGDYVEDVDSSILNVVKGSDGKDYLVNVWPTDLSINDPSRDKNYQDYKEQVKKDIEAVRDQVDVLMVAMHWGVEYTHNPTEYEKDSAKFLADNGVNIVIGAHPHVIQPVEWIDKTLVIYSLGNFEN